MSVEEKTMWQETATVIGDRERRRPKRNGGG